MRTAWCIRYSREVEGAKVQYVVDQAWKRRCGITLRVSEREEAGQLDLLGVAEWGGASFREKAFVCPIHLHRAVQGPVQVTLEFVDVRWVVKITEVQEVVREDARFP